MSSSKPSISVYIFRPGLDVERRLLLILPREKLVAHSGEFERFLAYWPVADESKREITLSEGSPSALLHVLQIIKSHSERQQLYIGMREMPITHKLAVWNACQILDLRPAKALEGVSNNLGWVISHSDMTPEIMKVAYDCTNMWRESESKEKRKLWDAMIHQYVWDLIHGKYSKEQEEAMVKFYSRHAELAEAIDEKFEELKAKNDQFHENRVENFRRRDLKRMKRAKGHREATQASRVEEVVAGLRPMTEDVKDAVLARQRVGSGEKQGESPAAQQ